ncbi:LysE family translocator [Nocardioides pakistanensis]
MLVLFQLSAAAAVLALLTVVPGPDLAVVTRRALVGGFGDGLRTALGVASGLLVWGALAVLGLTALLASAPTAYLVVKVAGVVYLLFLGVQALAARDREADVENPIPRRDRPFLTGLSTNLLNPKIAIFYTALLPTLAPAAVPAPWSMAVLVGIHALLTVTWFAGFSYALTRARAVFERPRVRRALDRLTGVVLVGFAIRLATDHA